MYRKRKDASNQSTRSPFAVKQSNSSASPAASLTSMGTDSTGPSVSRESSVVANKRRSKRHQAVMAAVSMGEDNDDSENEPPVAGEEEDAAMPVVEPVRAEVATEAVEPALEPPVEAMEVDEPAPVVEFSFDDPEEPEPTPAPSTAGRKKKTPAPKKAPAPKKTNPKKPTAPKGNKKQAPAQAFAFPTMDPIVAILDAEFDSTAIDPVVASRARANFATQTQNLAPRVPSGQIDDSLTGEFISQLAHLDIQVMSDLGTREKYFYIGEKNCVDIVADIEAKWPKEDTVIAEQMAIIKNQLGEEVDMWLLFLRPSRNINGTQDTIIRALLLSKTFQTEIFSLLIRRLDTIAQGNADPEWTEIAGLILPHFRFLTEVFNSKAFFTVVFDKRIEMWSPEYRDQFITLLPEVVPDILLHCNIAKKLIEFIMIRGVEKEDNFRKVCLEALKPLELTPRVRQRIQFVLSKNMMLFDAETLPTAISTILHVMDKKDPTSFKNLLVCLHKFLDVDKLKRIEEDVGLSKPLDECLAEVFNHVSDFIRFHFSSSHRDLMKVFAMQRLSRRAVEACTRRTAAPSNASDDDDDEYTPSSDEEEEADAAEAEAAGEFIVTIRDLDVIDIFLIFTYFDVQEELPLIMKEVKKRIETTYDGFVFVRNLFVDALQHAKFAFRFLNAAIAVARSMVFSSSTRMNAIGSAIFTELFISQSLRRQHTLEALKHHFCEVDHEASVALQVLEGIAETHTQLLRPYLEDINELVGRVKVLSTENIRRLFFVLVSVNQFNDVAVGPSTQTLRIAEGKRFITLLDSYLTAVQPKQVVWGVVGFIQKVKALLYFPNASESQSDDEIAHHLDSLDKKTADYGGAIRSEFYYQICALLKSNVKLNSSQAMHSFGIKLLTDIRDQFYHIRDGPNLDATTLSQLSLGPYDSEEFIDISSNLWINLCDLVEADKRLTGPMLSLLPMLEAAKCFAIYSDNYRYNSIADSDADPTRSALWEGIMFMLEANINLSPLTNTPDTTDEDLRYRCNVLYVAVEYLRTILNLFADCHMNDRVGKLMEKRLNLLFYCENQLKIYIKRLGMYELPSITRVNASNLIVKHKDAAKKPATGTKRGRKKKATTEAAGADPNTTTATDMEVDTTLPPESNDIFADVPMPDASMTQMTQQTQVQPSGQRKTAETTPTKKNAVPVEQLSWYCTPLRLETVTRMLQVVGMKRKAALTLVEILHMMLKHTMPTTTTRAMPAGFGASASAPIPLSVMDFGPKEQRWRTISTAIPCLFDILSRAVDSFTRNTAQVPQSNPADFVQEMTNLLKFSVLIFSRIFQSKDINDFVSNDSLGATGVRSRRDNVIEALSNAIGVFNTSRVGQGTDRDGSAVTTRPSTAASNRPSTSIGRISHGNSTTNVEMPSRGGAEEVVVDFFLEVANLVPTAETATAVLALLKSFSSMNEFQKHAAAKTAMFLLSKNWSKAADDLLPSGSEDKQAAVIAEEYLAFRPQKERLTAVIWLITHQLTSLYSPAFLEREGVVIDDFDDTEAYVNQYKEAVFPCFNKKSFALWYKLLFKHFTDYVLKDLDKSSKEFVDRPRAFVTLWKDVAKTFLFFSLAIREKQYRLQNVLVTSAREAKRFIGFIMTKKSSFRMALQDERKMSIYCDELLWTLKRIQLANRTFQRIRSEALERRNPVLLRLMGDLNSAHEKFMNQFQLAAAEGGFFKSVSFGDLRNKTLDGTELDDAEPAPKKRKTTARQQPAEDAEASVEVLGAKKGKKRAPKKSAQSGTAPAVKAEPPDASGFMNQTTAQPVDMD
uniref:Fanconi anemia group D2 protein n=1 Tax=Panagrellus redivivus TaxID=6233 RepID=A0A7E4ZW11_PANRE